MSKLYLVKLGGSVITDINKPNAARLATIDRLMEEIKRGQGNNRIILGHGAGSFGHVVAHRFKVNDGIKGKGGRKGAVLTQFSASALHSIVMDRAIRAGVYALSFSPSTGVISKNKRIISWDVSPIRKVLEYGFLPIGYGDLVIDSGQGFSVASTEEIMRYLAMRLRPDKIIVGTDVDGVFTADPKSDRSAKLISRINSSNIGEVLDMVGGSKKIDVTGGMRGKLEHLYRISRQTSIPCQIVNADRKGALYAALKGKKIGTEITAR